MSDPQLLPGGKLDLELLAELLGRLLTDDPSVVQGPGIGLDAAILDDGGPDLLVAKTDPITFATDAIGYYAVAVNSNDIAVCGAEPRWMMATVLLPEGSATAARARDIFAQITEACQKMGVILVGGHTEVTPAVTQPVVVGAMLGRVERGRQVSAAGARPGDVVLLAGAAAIEGTALLAREKADDLRRRGYDAEFLRRCAEMLYDPGISVLPAARAAKQAGGLHAMHDPTEGGIATGLWEMALASGRRIVADPGAVPVAPETASLCAEYGLDPLGVIASGALLLAVDPVGESAVRQAILDTGRPCVAIGHVEEGEAAVVTHDARLWPRYDQDEVTKALGG
ncbi:MAG: AIR synthase family protein [Armatimonadetes bacterium]|nr:AIR synthase family protein [Armatimonadota bacterium]